MNALSVTKLGVLIEPSLFTHETDGLNINGPSLIKVPDFVPNPLGAYYLYFGHHKGDHIRMAYSNEIDGHYTLYEGGVLHLSQIVGHDHLASPDVVIDEENKQIRMYYHCPYTNNHTSHPQSTFYAISTDGIHFAPTAEPILGYPYFRYFTHHHESYGIAMNKLDAPNTSFSVVAKKDSTTDEYTEIQSILPGSRHTCVLCLQDKVYLFYSTVGDCPEHICMCELIIDNTNIYTQHHQSIVLPELHYEHSGKEPIQSVYGISHHPVCQLRDPFVYVEKNVVYLLYTISGEKGIAIATIDGL